MTGTIDLELVRQARENLDRIAAENPGLLGESTAEDWIRVIEEIEEAERMAKTVQVGVRFPAEVVEAIDRFAEITEKELREKQNLPGLEVNRATAIRILVEQALNVRGYDTKRETTGKKRGEK